MNINKKAIATAGLSLFAGPLFAGVPLNNLQGAGGIAFNPLAYTAGRPWSGDGGDGCHHQRWCDCRGGGWHEWHYVLR